MSTRAWYGMVEVCEGAPVAVSLVWYGKEDKIKLEPSVASGMVASTVAHPWYVCFGFFWVFADRNLLRKTEPEVTITFPGPLHYKLPLRNAPLPKRHAQQQTRQVWDLCAPSPA